MPNGLAIDRGCLRKKESDLKDCVVNRPTVDNFRDSVSTVTVTLTLTVSLSTAILVLATARISVLFPVSPVLNHHFDILISMHIPLD